MVNKKIFAVAAAVIAVIACSCSKKTGPSPLAPESATATPAVTGTSPWGVSYLVGVETGTEPRIYKFGNREKAVRPCF